MFPSLLRLFYQNDLKLHQYVIILMYTINGDVAEESE
jgi:hypothetical protein